MSNGMGDNKDVHTFAISNNNIFSGTSNSGVYLSTDYGQSWSQTSLNNKNVYSLAITGNNIFAGTYDISTPSGLYLSTNNGQNWTQTALNNKEILSLAITGNIVFAGAWANGVYLSTNSGVIWIRKNQGFNQIPSVKALFIANNYIFAGTLGHSVWRSPLSDIIGVQSISSEIPSSFSLSQNYPNPFNSMTKVKFQIANSGKVKITVFDILGKEVATLVNEPLQPGTYETTFDASNLSSGIYFYKLQTKNFSETKKMTLKK